METTIILLLLALTFISLAVSQKTLTFTILEEQQNGSLVGNVTDVPLNVPPEEKNSVRYSFFNNDSPSQGYFTIGDVNGIIRTQVRLDRESICKGLLTSKCEIDFKVAAKTVSLTFFETINVKVIIEDINDNAPLFPKDNITLEILEGANSVNTKYSIPSAEDPDTGGTNGIQNYTIYPSSEMFGVLYEKNLDGTFKVQIIVKKELNRELQDLYQIQIVAADGGTPPRTGLLKVEIRVTDINDNKPVFDVPVYNVSVDEGLTRGSTVLTVHATDGDIGDNALVSYRISDRYTQILQDFSLNSSTGEIKVASDKLIYQPDLFYGFIVEAVDHGAQPQISQVYVYIYVLDTGNNPPKVTLSLLSPGNTGVVNVSENSKAGSFVAHIIVEDPDTGDNGKVECFVSNNFFGVVKLEEEGAYKVVVSNTLDREVLDLHNVTVTCADHGDPQLSSVVSFLVRVMDYNDNKPEFPSLNYQAKIKENTMINQVILQVSATDKDIGDNQKVHYEIRNQDKIMIDPVTGVISVKPFFDREKMPIVIFTVLAIDAGDPSLTGTATVTLTIEDVNDNAPLFTQESYEFQIQENLNTGTQVAQLSARDLDTGSNGIFTFSSNSGARFPFHVFDTTGIITLTQELDREEIGSYEFNVIVTDQGNPALSSTAKVIIIVTDDNDNCPNITFPTPINKTVSVYYPSEEVSVVTQIMAHDLDAGENKTLHYSIEKGNELGLFVINENTGLITIKDYSVMIDQDISIVLLIKVHDNGVKSLASSAELIVNVIYTNATYEELEGASSKFVVIVVVVVIVTVLLSALIIGVIFFLRTRDRRKKLSDSKSSSDDAGFTNKQTLYIMNNSGESSTDYIVTGSEMGRKKKEVSFSLDDHDSINNYQHTELRVNMSPEPSQYAPEKPARLEKCDSTQDLYNKVNTRLESLKLQRMLQIAKQQQHVPHPDDSRSESSGETSSGDSGRGASEEEVTSASPSHDDQKMFDYSMSGKLPSANHSLPSSRPEHYSAVPPPIPCRTYKPYSSFNNNQSYTPNNRQYLSAPLNYKTDLSVLDPSKLSWQPSQPHSHHPMKSSVPIAQNDLAYFMAQNAQHRRRSQDDDDCSTTTSGSYTLHSVEDLL